MKQPIRWSLMFMLIAIAVLLWTIPALGSELTRGIQEKYQSIQSLKTDFVQKLTNASSGETEKRYGRIYFRKPGHIRWEEERPGQELLIVDGEVAWDYFPDEGIVYKHGLEEKFESQTMLKFITGDVDLAGDFRIERQGKEQGWAKIKLIPKNPEPSLVLAYIWVEEDSFLLRQILLVDFFGNGNQLAFSNLELNVALDDNLFDFTPPEDVIVRENPDQ